MIPVSQIVPQNLYSQDDAELLLGGGFSRKAAREAICEACRSGQLRSTQWRKRYWFSGKAFLEWVGQWFGSERFGDENGEGGSLLAGAASARHNGERRFGARSPSGKEVSK